MKVVHLIPAMEQGGVESVICNLNRALVAAGWESVIVSRGGRLEEQIVADGGRHLGLDLKSKNPLTYLPRVLKLRALLKTEKPDLVCAHSRVPAWLYVGVRALDSTLRRFDASTISPRWITYAHGANSVSRYSEVMTRGDLTIVPSRFLADYLKAHYPIDDAKLRVIPNAVDLERFSPEHIDAAYVAAKRREWGIAADAYVAMSIGRITPLKGFDHVIRDFYEGHASDPNARLVIVGGVDRGKEGVLEELQALADCLRISDRVIFAGAQEKIPECLMIASEVVSGNKTKPESFGLSVAEALAMNRPVRLLRHFGGAGEVLEDVAQERAANTREAVRKLYDFAIISSKTIGAYKDLLK